MESYFRSVLFCILFFNCSNLVWANKCVDPSKGNNFFQFVISHYQTTCQSGQEVNIYVRYAYKDNVPNDQYFDYRSAREDILKYMEPTKEFPKDVYWEILATEMGKKLMNTYPIKGVSVQLEVLDNQKKDSFEPGDHGPIYTLGEIEPLSVIHEH